MNTPTAHELEQTRQACQTLTRWSQLMRRVAYAQGQVDYGFKTHSLELMAGRILDLVDMHQAVNSLFGVE